MSNRSNSSKRQDRAAYAERRAARELKSKVEASFFSKCLLCSMKHRCTKERTKACRSEVRERLSGSEG